MILEILGITLLISLIIFGLVSIDQKKKSETIKSNVLSTLESIGTIEHKGKHLLFKKENQTYEVLFYYVPLNSDLTINSRSIWEIRDASKSRLIDQTYYLSSQYQKMVIVYPTSIAIKRYINENELEFVKFNKPFYDMYVIRHFELDEWIKEVLV
jgi:hypothetical protein